MQLRIMPSQPTKLPEEVADLIALALMRYFSTRGSVDFRRDVRVYQDVNDRAGEQPWQ
jgi:hypothetical protein